MCAYSVIPRKRLLLQVYSRIKEMEKIKWTERFCLNIEAIDKQHKQLIEFTNKLLDAVKQNTGNEINDLFYLLKQYSERHFKFEEDYIEKNAPHLLEEQQLEHKNFMNTINRLYSEYDSGNQETALKLLDFLIGWIYEHILYTDKKIPKAVNLKISSESKLKNSGNYSLSAG